MSTGKQQPPSDSAVSPDQHRQAQTPSNGRPIVGKPLTIDDVRARLAEGLRPGEDLLFYDLNRFGERRPAQPSEMEVYEPPRELAAPKDGAGESDADKVVLHVTGNTAPPDGELRRGATTSERPGDATLLKRMVRARGKDIAYSFFVVIFSSLLGWWFLWWQRESDAHRKMPASLVPQPAMETPRVIPTRRVGSVPNVDDKPTEQVAGPSKLEHAVPPISPTSSSHPKSRAPAKRDPRTTNPAPELDPTGRDWLDPER